MQKTWQKTCRTARITVLQGSGWPPEPLVSASLSVSDIAVARRSRPARRSVGSGGEDGGWSLPVVVERETVDHERVAEQVHELAFVAETVGPAEPEGVVEVPVDALGVVAPLVEPVEVG